MIWIQDPNASDPDQIWRCKKKVVIVKIFIFMSWYDSKKSVKCLLVHDSHLLISFPLDNNPAWISRCLPQEIFIKSHFKLFLFSIAKTRVSTLIFLINSYSFRTHISQIFFNNFGVEIWNSPSFLMPIVQVIFQIAGLPKPLRGYVQWCLFVYLKT